MMALITSPAAVCVLVASPRAKGLFRRAHISSGPCIGAWGPGSAADGRRISGDLMRSRRVGGPRNTSVLPLAELRELPAANLSSWTNKDFGTDQLFPGYFVDGWVMAAAPKAQRQPSARPPFCGLLLCLLV